MVVGGRVVVVTGIGLVSPVGAATDDFWSALIERRSGITPVTRFDASSYRCQVAGQIEDTLFAPLVHPRKLRNTPRASQLGLAATALALADAGWSDHRYPGERVGTLIGTALGGWTDTEQQFAILLDRGARRINPFIANATPPGAIAGEIAGLVGAHGPQLTFSNGCPASLTALGHAAALIAAGDLDAAFVGGVESPLSPLVFAGMGRTQELSAHHQPPQEACRPFDIHHDGMVLSEGACMLVLEAEELAHQRGRPGLSRILASGSSSDAGGVFDLDTGGVIAANAVRRALSGLAPASVDYICAHGNGSPSFDRKEVAVIKIVFGADTTIPVSSIKGVLGHPFGAAGAFQVAAATLALRHQLIPPTANLTEPAPDCVLNHVSRGPLAANLATILVTSYGYGGVNAALVVGRT